MFVRMVKSCLIINVKQISLFYAENVLKMRKMRKSANYADPHHRILSDALLIGLFDVFFVIGQSDYNFGSGFTGL